MKMKFRVKNFDDEDLDALNEEHLLFFVVCRVIRLIYPDAL